MFQWAKALVGLRRNSIATRDPIEAGNRLLAEGQLEEAAASYGRAIAHDSRCVEGYVNLGFALKELGQRQEALKHLTNALQIDPTQADAHYLLGQLMEAQQDAASATRHYEAAVASRPTFVRAYADLCRLYFHAGRLDAAQLMLEKGLELDGSSVILNLYRGNICLAQRAYPKAIDCYKYVLTMLPDSAIALSNLAKAYLEQGAITDAIANYRKVLALDDVQLSMEARSSILFARCYQPGNTPDEYLAEARQYGALLKNSVRPFDTWKAVARATFPLRVGFVSGDLWQHPVGFFLESLLKQVDPGRLTITAYSTVSREDELTARIKPCFQAWRCIEDVDDATAANMIHDDGIHVLVDLSGHTANNRLPVFAWKPAPVQVSWLGYFASTGVPGIDYLLTDRFSVPEAEQRYFTESIWYLPDTRLCFSPPLEAGQMEVTPLPALATGNLTFGCFQNLAKINEDVLTVWARIFRALPDARLRVQNKQMADPGMRNLLINRMQDAGIRQDQVFVEGPTSREDYLDAYRKVDVLLDTFPYPGGTTTCEGIWMGVPTLSLAGTSMLARQGASIMTSIGLRSWVAGGHEDYVAKAVALSEGIGDLAELRKNLRERALKSPLFDASRFAANFEDALVGMWRRYLDSTVSPDNS